MLPKIFQQCSLFSFLFFFFPLNNSLSAQQESLFMISPIPLYSAGLHPFLFHSEQMASSSSEPLGGCIRRSTQLYFANLRDLGPPLSRLWGELLLLPIFLGYTPKDVSMGRLACPNIPISQHVIRMNPTFQNCR